MTARRSPLALLLALAACATPAEALRQQRYDRLCHDARRDASERGEAVADALFTRVTLEAHNLTVEETLALFGDVPITWASVGWLVVKTDLLGLTVGPVGVDGDPARELFAALLPSIPDPEFPTLPPGPLPALAPGPMPKQAPGTRVGVFRGLLAIVEGLAQAAVGVAVGATVTTLGVSAGIAAGERYEPSIDLSPLRREGPRVPRDVPRIQGEPVLPPDAWQAAAAEPLERYRRAREDHQRRLDERAQRLARAVERLGGTCRTGAGLPPCRLLVAMDPAAERYQRVIPLVADLGVCTVPFGVDWGHDGISGPARALTTTPSVPTAPAPQSDPGPPPWRERLADLRRLEKPYRAYREGSASLVCRLRVKPAFDHERALAFELAVGAIAGRSNHFMTHETRGGAHYFGIEDPIARGDHVVIAAHDWVNQFGVLHLVADRPRISVENEAVAVDCRVRFADDPRSSP